MNVLNNIVGSRGVNGGSVSAATAAAARRYPSGEADASVGIAGRNTCRGQLTTMDLD